MEVVFDPRWRRGPNDVSAEDQFKSTKKLIVCGSFGRQGLLASFPAARSKNEAAIDALLPPGLLHWGRQ
jgi:hypothetical protein